MSYIVIRVYSFECDAPDCNVSNIEVLPRDGTLRGALRTLRDTEGWTVDLRHGKPQYCPKHGGEG
jgi:hypothetical protein